MKGLAVLGIGVVGPGLPDWAEAREVLRGTRPYVSAPASFPAPACLPPNERRRATLPTRIALEAARQATAVPGLDLGALRAVFASSDGDLDLIDRLCTDLYGARVPVSPTLFHNSVHNAVAGYWSIATGCRQATTSLAAWDGSFAAGLLECAGQLAWDRRPVLLVAYDLPATGTLDAHRHFPEPFACALVLDGAPEPDRAAALELALTPPGAEDRLPTDLGPELETLRAGNPAARALTLLRLLAVGAGGRLRLPYLDDLDLTVTLG